MLKTVKALLFCYASEISLTKIPCSYFAVEDCVQTVFQVNLIGEKVVDPLIHCCEKCSLPILIYGRMVCLLPSPHNTLYTSTVVLKLRFIHNLSVLSPKPMLSNKFRNVPWIVCM